MKQETQNPDAVRVVEVNPRTFSKRYGQQLSKDAAEQFRSSRRSVGGRQTRPVVQNQSTTTVSATPVTIAAIPRPQQKTRVAAYARVSTLMESQQTSIEAQRQHFEDEIRANPDYEFAGVYLEAGVSGTKTEIRPELQRLLQDCRDQKIDLILTKSISRFSRNLQDCLEMVRMLKELGVSIFFERENIHTGKMGSEFILSVYACLAEEESHSISGNMKWGIRKRFQDGSYQQPRTPFGYEWKPTPEDQVQSEKQQSEKHKCGCREKELVIVPEEAAVVRRIYAMALNGCGMVTIAKTLNEEQIPSPTGGQWTQSTLRNLVANPVYMGDMLYQKTYKDEDFKQVKNTGELDQYYDTGHHEPIVDKEIFEATQAVVAQRAREVGYSTSHGQTYSRSRQKYCFTGILTCKACGSTMHRQVWKGKYTGWICHKHVVHPELCLMKPQSDADLKRAFLNCLNKLAWSQKSANPEHRILDQYEKLLGKTEVEKNAERLTEIETALEVNRREMRQLMAVVMRERFLPEHREKKTRLDQEEKQLLTEKNRILIHGAGDGTLQELKEFVGSWGMTQDVRDFPESEFTRFVEGCTVLTNKMVTFHFRCGLKLTESLYKVELATPDRSTGLDAGTEETAKEAER